MGGDRFKEQLALRAAFLKDQGLDYAFDRPEATEPSPAKAAPLSPEKHSPPSPAVTTKVSEAAPPAAQGDPAARLRDIRAEIGDCQRCPLCQGRTQIVFGVGDPRAKILFVGEGPGAEEDRKGEPFVGRAGQLLTDIITKGMGLKRPEVYIANVVKCRPPDNRVPEPEEMAACLPFLEAQINAIRPQVIVALGATAVHGLLGVKVQITKFRGEWTNYKGTPLMPTFHPSYLLRNPAAKKEVWSDIQEVMRKVGIPVPGKG